MMHQAAGASNGNEDYQGYDEGAEGLDEEGLHEFMILEAQAKNGYEPRRNNQNHEVRMLRAAWGLRVHCEKPSGVSAGLLARGFGQNVGTGRSTILAPRHTLGLARDPTQKVRRARPKTGLLESIGYVEGPRLRQRGAEKGEHAVAGDVAEGG
jgi:hypothetical protein